MEFSTVRFNSERNVMKMPDIETFRNDHKVSKSVFDRRTTTENNENVEILRETKISFTKKKLLLQILLPAKLHRSVPADLRSYILQLYVDDKLTDTDNSQPRDDIVISQMDRNATDVERLHHSENVSTGPFADVIFSNLHSRLDQSSSLLSSGSLFSLGECKKKAIESLKIKGKYNVNVANFIGQLQ